MKQMKKLLTLVCSILIAASAFGQIKAASFEAGTYYAPAYNYQVEVWGGGSTAGGAYSIILFKPTVTLADGRVVNPFSTSTPITIGQGANQETVTPSAVSGCGIGQPLRGCTITATFTNAHGKGDIIQSSTNGWAEALQDAANNGGGLVYWQMDCGVITLSTSGTTTTSTCNVPKTFTDGGASVYVTTTITTSASYSVGIASATTGFVTSCTSLTAGTNCGQFQTAPGSVATGTGTGALLITTNANAGAGKVHVKAWGYTAAQSNF